MFYEAEHSMTVTDLMTTAERADFQFPMHLHKAFEWIAVTEGTMRIHIEKTDYTVHAGEAVLIFPNQVHGMETVGHSRHFLTIAAPEYVRAFMPFCMNHVPLCNRFTPSPTLVSQMRTLSKEDGILHIKRVLYALADEFDAAATYRERQPEKEALLFLIFDYVDKNYDRKCTLQTLSEQLSYQYTYLSRYFAERVGVSFSQYVLRYRLSESCYRLTASEASITEIALSCGFESLRSFHRNFMAQFGCTPSAYRRRPGKLLERSFPDPSRTYEK